MKWFMNFFKTDTIKSVSNDVKNVKIFKFGTQGGLIVIFIIAIYLIAKSSIEYNLKELLVLKFAELVDFLVRNWKGV